MAGRWTSSTNCARPVSSRASSLRLTELPTNRFTLLGGRLHRGDHVRVACAPAEIAGKGVADLVLRRRRVIAQERHEGHENARRAEAALQRVRFMERALDRMELRICVVLLNGARALLFGQ